MPGEITLEIKVKGNERDLNYCHPYCNYLHLVEGHRAVLCRLFRTEKYLTTDTSGFSVEFIRCAECIDAQVEVKTWAEPAPPEPMTTEQVRLLLQGRIDQQDKYIEELKFENERFKCMYRGFENQFFEIEKLRKQLAAAETLMANMQAHRTKEARAETI